MEQQFFMSLAQNLVTVNIKLNAVINILDEDQKKLYEKIASEELIKLFPKINSITSMDDFNSILAEFIKP